MILGSSLLYGGIVHPEEEGSKPGRGYMNEIPVVTQKMYLA
jgi:hypothetical protein